MFIKHAKAHGGGIIAVAVDTAHDTLIIAEEEDGEPSYAVDEDEESPLFVLAGYIVARDVIHGYFAGPWGSISSRVGQIEHGGVGCWVKGRREVRKSARRKQKGEARERKRKKMGDLG